MDLRLVSDDVTHHKTQLCVKFKKLWVVSFPHFALILMFF